jgi:GR25 family glycosyltransferase involved in LPS biosynthesis
MKKSQLNELVDNIYVMNLEKDLFKYNILKGKLDEKNIKHERFICIDGYNDSLSLIEKEKAFKRVVDEYRDSPLYEPILIRGAEILANGHGAFRSRGAMGCLLSIKKIFENAVENEYKKILIFQDDIYFHNHFEEMLEERAGTIESSSVFWLGATEYQPYLKNVKWGDPNWNYGGIGWKRIKYESTLKTCGMFGVIIDKKIFEPVINLLKFKYFAGDQSLSIIANNMFADTSWVSYPNIVIADTTFSNTFEGASYGDKRIHRPLSETADNMRWNLDFYDTKERYYNDYIT